MFLADGDSTDETFAKLKNLGVRLALDDFGTGYSSLGYLKKAPFDKIKIDQSFVRGAASPTSRNSAIIRAIVSLAESLEMETCAEGVETHDDLALIRELGCSHVQGYIFGRPAGAKEARELANRVRVEADGFECLREPRHRLMRRAISMIDGFQEEVRLRNISVTGALVECRRTIAAGHAADHRHRRRRPGRRHRALGAHGQVRGAVRPRVRPGAARAQEGEGQRRDDDAAVVRRAEGRRLSRFER